MGRREDNKRAKREALEQAAIDAFRAEGYAEASIERIARAAGVARGTFYLYFDSKLALFDALVDRWAAPAGAAIGVAMGEIGLASEPADALAAYRRMAAGLAAVVLAHRDVIEIAFRESRQPGEAGQSLRARELALLGVVGGLTEAAAAKGLIRVEDPRLFGLVVYGAVERLAWEALAGEPLGDPEQVALVVSSWFGRALGVASP